ncbi:MAG: SGNH/GDSL hydrolase family protein [Clostridia bacterium]|nr:SGNH/GDSL hydrolase family protein [Clostridia bacterium]
MKIEGLKINFLGDSITQGCGVYEPENMFVNRIAKMGAICRNYGLSGTRIARQHKPSEHPQLDMYFESRLEGMENDADLVLVFGGTNDMGHGDAEIGTMSDRTPDTFYGAMHSLCISLINKYPGKVIAFMTPLHCWYEDNDRACGKAGHLIDYVNAEREVAQYYSLPVLDLYACSGLQCAVPVIKEKYVPDGLHPNDDGHAILAARIAAFIKSL